MKKLLCFITCIFLINRVFCWGFFAHQRINYYAVFLLPPEMMLLYKPNIYFISEHAVDPDKRRYVMESEGAHHFIDIDHYGRFPFSELPHDWKKAEEKFTRDSLIRYGIVPWWILIEKQRLTLAFKEKDRSAILKISADIGHYIADAHVPLHASTNHNGQLTGQQGIHGFWESRIPELLAEKEWDFLIGKADYIKDPAGFIWNRVLESASAADTVLNEEKKLSGQHAESYKYGFEERKGKLVHQYSTAFSLEYDSKLNHMIERRMRQSIYAVASFWYTSWVDAGQPDLKLLTTQDFSESEIKEFYRLDSLWKTGIAVDDECNN
jgi:hypothetical protein